jgi:hypothetical protein
MPQGDDLPFNVNVISNTLSYINRLQRHTAAHRQPYFNVFAYVNSKTQKNDIQQLNLYIFKNVTLLPKNVTDSVTTNLLIINGNNRAESDL